ncbi:MAG: hypothetical protein E7642_02420 [Ruminococcaceae bacterium]|nr:hypothetical protein [Oscillospiraceae bacterium]
MDKTISTFHGLLRQPLVEDAINEEFSGETWIKAGYNALWGAAGGALGGLIAGPCGTSLASKTVKFLKHPISNTVSEFVENLILDFSKWYFESGVEYFVNRLIERD